MKNIKIVFLIIIMFVSLFGFNVFADTTNIINVKHISQMPNLPTGCEATSLTMLLNSAGLNITKEQTAKDMVKVPVPIWKNGKMYGEHPQNAFIGNPFSNAGYGVYNKPVAKQIEQYFPGRSEDLSGKTFEDILKVIDQGRPVMIWTTMRMANMTLTRTWQTPNDGSFTWKAPQHAMLLVGYDDNYIYVHDPQKNSRSKYKRDVSKNRWISMGRMAVAIKPPIKEKNMTVDMSKTTFRALETQDGLWIPIRSLDMLDLKTTIDYIDKRAVINSKNIIIKIDPLGESFNNQLDGKDKNIPYINYNDSIHISSDWVEDYFKCTIENKDSVNIRVNSQSLSW